MKLLGNNPQLITIPQGVGTPNSPLRNSAISSSLVVTHKDITGFAKKRKDILRDHLMPDFWELLISGRAGKTVEHITQTRGMQSLLKTGGLGHVWKAAYNACVKMEHLTQLHDSPCLELFWHR